MTSDRYESYIKMSHDAYMEASQKAGDIDEVSLLFDSHEEFREFVKEAKARGDHFATSMETQERTDYNNDPPVFSPPSRRYKTIYEFIWPNPYDGYRIEAMYVRGFSSLHEALFEWQGSEVVVAHASFKCRSLDDYNDACTAMRNSDIREFAAEYKNDYGIFSYFAADGLAFYLKPRINLRDL